MLHMLVAAAADSASNSGLSVDNPFVLGPLAAFIFTIFVSEIVVSGKAYRREVEENARLRGINEKVIPLAENMVTTTREMTATMSKVAEVMERTLDYLPDPYDDDRPPRRRRAG